MIIPNDASTPVAVGYTTLIETIEKEKTIRIKSISIVVESLIEDARNNSLSQYDDEGNATYAASVQSKLRIIAKLFSNDTISCEGMSDAFHNLAVDYARQEMYSEACIILERGIALRPSSVDLLSDYLLYGRNVPECRTKCEAFYNTLTSIPRSKWNWRAYSFSIDHLLEERNYAISADQEREIKARAIKIAKDFITKYSKQHSEHDNVDRAYADLAGIYRAFGDSENEYKVLKKCADSYRRVPITSMRLAEIEYSSGNYSEATRYLSNCAVALRPQPSVNQGYVFLLRAHSNASMYFADSLKKDNINDYIEERDNILSAINKDLDTAELLIDNATYKNSITTLRKILEKQCGETERSIEEDWT